MKEYHDPEVLKELYNNQRLTQKEIGNKFSVSRATITKWINKHGIEREKAEYQNSEVLIELYHKKEMSLSDIGDKFDVCNKTIEYWMKKHDIERREQTNKRLPCYIEDVQGYRVWRHRDGEKRQTVRVHRLLAVSEFGFEAVKDMDVHHKNGCRFDNRPDNIEIMTRGKHITLHNKERANNNNY